MEIKQSFILCKKDKEKIQNLNFRIQAHEQLMSFLMKQFNYENGIAINALKEWMTEYSEKIVAMREEYIRLGEKLNAQFEENILTIPYTFNIKYELNPKKGTIDYTYEIKDFYGSTE